MKKSVKKIGLIALIVLVVLVVLFYFFAESALKLGIEVGASKALKVGVKVDSVSLSVLRGELKLKNLVIDNPIGYANKTFLKLDEAEVKVELGSLMSDLVNIKKIRLDGISLWVEQKGFTNNLSELMKNIQSGQTEKPKEAKPGKKLHIDDLEITNISVNVKLLPIPGKSDTIPLKLLPIRMHDIGGKEDVDVGELTKKILAAIAQKIAEAGTGILPEGMLNDIKGGLKQLGALSGAIIGEGGKVLEKGGDLGKGVIEGGKDVGEGIKKGIEGIFGPKEKK